MYERCSYGTPVFNNSHRKYNPSGCCQYTWSTYVAAMTAGSKMFNFTCCPFDALGSTMATYAGQNVGAAKIKRLGQGVRSAMIIGSVTVFFLLLHCISLQIILHYYSLMHLRQQLLLLQDSSSLHLHASTFRLQVLTWSASAYRVWFLSICNISRYLRDDWPCICSIILIPSIGFMGGMPRLTNRMDCC